MDDDSTESMLELRVSEVEGAAWALVKSIGCDGQPTPETIDLTRDAVVQFLDDDDDERRLIETSAFLTVLLRLLAQMAAVSSEELKRRGVDVPWR